MIEEETEEGIERKNAIENEADAPLEEDRPALAASAVRCTFAMLKYQS
jgi:hypothetical protein